MALDSFGLTLKQRLFCEHYIANDGNGTKAAIAAGYSEDTAKEMACENLTKPHIKKYIKDKMSNTFERLGVGIDWRVNSLKKVYDACLEGRADKDGCVDAKGAVSTIAEMNKMDGTYAPEKHAMLVEEAKEGEVKGLIKEIEIKEY